MGVDATQFNRVLDGCHTKGAEIARPADETASILVTKDGDFRDSRLLRDEPAPRCIELGRNGLRMPPRPESQADRWR